MAFFIGECGHCGFISKATFKKKLPKELLEALSKPRTILRMKICPGRSQKLDISKFPQI
jgi:hypothetical protein